MVGIPGLSAWGPPQAACGGLADHYRVSSRDRTDVSGGLWWQHDRAAAGAAAAQRVFGSCLDGGA